MYTRKYEENEKSKKKAKTNKQQSTSQKNLQ